MKITLFLILALTISFNSLALDPYRCESSNAKLSYEGVDIPLGDSDYLNGEVLGQIFVTLTYRCQTQNSQFSNATARIGITHPTETIDSTVSGIKLRSLDFSQNVAGHKGTVIMEFTRAEHPTKEYAGTMKKAIFEVVKSGQINFENNKDGIQLWAAGEFKMLNYMWYGGAPEYYDIVFDQASSQTSSIPVYNASCNITHPTNIELPTLIPGTRDEVNSHFNVVLNCGNKAVMQNNIQLTVNPVNTTGVSLSADKSSLLYDFGDQVVSMNIFNSVGTETPMLFSTMYQFNNSSQTNSFTIPMRAKFMLGFTESIEYGSFSFQTQISVQYN
ncbi:hypothetical protein [Vibrio owensii]|uniref:hypothetical protein n=1 Tax=Vibrio owensii TaxID=696485 RepID=UPI003DA1360E